MRVFAGNDRRAFDAQRPTGPDNYHQLRAAIDGRIPAEELHSQRDRCLYMYVMVLDLRLTDVQIAQRSGWTTYTVGRIREALGMRPNVYESAERTA